MTGDKSQVAEICPLIRGKCQLELVTRINGKLNQVDGQLAKSHKNCTSLSLNVEYGTDRLTHLYRSPNFDLITKML